jgi:hypothetical protein
MIAEEVVVSASMASIEAEANGGYERGEDMLLLRRPSTASARSAASQSFWFV